MKKLPNGISNYEELITENYIYIDKTQYIEKLEELSNKRIMFLRPRKFGKTLFTSTLENYYDILKEDKFEKLFGETYIGKNPTAYKNKYHILKFNFSGIDTTNYETTIKGFKNKVSNSIEEFVARYKIDFIINEGQEMEELLGSLLTAFKVQKANQKIYVIIDEYDHFANELLGFRTEEFKELLQKNGKIRKWYEILKEGTETVIDRIFITGVAPITLDSMTSGFNISLDLSRNINFNEMLGFTEDEVKYLMKEVELNEQRQKELLPVIKKNYDGYMFSNTIQSDFEKHKMYNSNMTLFFLNSYQQLGHIPEELVDVNIASDYSKIEAMMDLCKNQNEVLEKLVLGEKVETKIVEKFNPEIGFGERELISLLYYMGYITIVGNEFNLSQLVIPNEIIKQIYSEYFLHYMKNRAGIEEEINVGELARELLIEGKIEKIIETLREYLKNLSNRDYQRFDEKYIKLLFYAIARMVEAVYVNSEIELEGKYADILITPKENYADKYSVLIEFKYIKKEDYDKDKKILKIKQEEAKNQIINYKKSEEIENVKKLRSYIVVAIKDELFVEEVKKN